MSCHPTCSTTIFRLQGQHLHCPYQRQCLAGGFHSSSCHCSSLFSISSTFPDERPTRCRCSKSARAASNVSRRWSHLRHSTSRVHQRGPFGRYLPLAVCSRFHHHFNRRMKALYWTRYTMGKRETTTMGNHERGCPGGSVGVFVRDTTVSISTRTSTRIITTIRTIPAPQHRCCQSGLRLPYPHP